MKLFEYLNIPTSKSHSIDARSTSFYETSHRNNQIVIHPMLKYQLLHNYFTIWIELFQTSFIFIFFISVKIIYLLKKQSLVKMVILKQTICLVTKIYNHKRNLLNIINIMHFYQVTRKFKYDNRLKIFRFRH